MEKIKNVYIHIRQFFSSVFTNINYSQKVNSASMAIQETVDRVNARNDRAFNRPQKNFSRDDFKSSPSRNSSNIGKRVGAGVSYFIGSWEVYCIIRDAAKRGGLEDIPRFVRTIETDRYRANYARIKT